MGVALSAITVFVIQGGIAASQLSLEPLMDEMTILAISATGGIILLGVALRLLDLKSVRVANFLPALVLAPLFVRVAEPRPRLAGLAPLEGTPPAPPRRYRRGTGPGPAPRYRPPAG